MRSQRMEQGDSVAALTCLRDSLKPLDVCAGDLHELAGCLMLTDAEELRQYSHRGTCDQAHRQSVLQALQVCSPACCVSAIRTVFCNTACNTAGFSGCS